MAAYVSAWRVMKKIRELNKLRRGGDREAVLRVQSVHLDRLLRFTLERCPFYRERFTGDVDHPSVRDFAPADKAAIMARFADVVTDPALRLDDLSAYVADPTTVGKPFLDRYVAAHTSGTSGTRGIFVIDNWGWEMGQALGLADRANPRFGWGWPRALAAPLRSVPVALVVPTGGHFASVLMPRVVSPWVPWIVDLREIDITRPLDEIVDALNAMKPFSLHSYPTMLRELAAAQAEGRLRIRPRMFTAGGEPFTPGIREALGRSWPKAPIFDIYACTEAMSIAKSCPEGRYHVNEDWLYIENVDDEGRPVPEGARGSKILVTHLYNYLMPLIRYEITDAVTWDASPCPCGLPLATMRIEGRANHTLTLPSATGVVRLLPLPIMATLMEAKGLRNYQIEQEGPDALIVRFVPEPGFEAADVQRRVEAVLRGHLDKHHVARSVRLTWQSVERIERDVRTHKITQVVNRWDTLNAGAGAA